MNEQSKPNAVPPALPQHVETSLTEAEYLRQIARVDAEIDQRVHYIAWTEGGRNKDS